VIFFFYWAENQNHQKVDFNNFVKKSLTWPPKPLSMWQMGLLWITRRKKINSRFQVQRYYVCCGDTFMRETIKSLPKLQTAIRPAN